MRSIVPSSVLCCLALGLLAGCTGLPSLENRSVSTALRDTGDTALGRAVAPRLVAHPGQCGIHSLADARDAFAARMLLARAAERSLDVQYYIWRDDLTGAMLFEALRAAAARGVRVRLLLDDNNTSGLDDTLAELAARPNIEVRLFNPFAMRGLRMLGFLTDFSRLNRRMHNKSFTADNQVTIVGGRNIGDEYFGATDGVLFSDLDVMAAGPVVGAVSNDFDRYWASGSSYPVGRLLGPATGDAGARSNADARAAAAAAVAEAELRDEPLTGPAALPADQQSEARAYIAAIRRSPFVERLLHGTLALHWATARLVSDDPDKGLDLADADERVFARLRDVIGDARRELQIVSPYFVPTRAGVAGLAALSRRGVQVKVLTNSLEATDVAVVHAGYAKWRKAMLEAGITLYESRRLAGGGARGGSSGFKGSSASSLHAKTFAADRERLFVGSFNFDPRSVALNTESGFVIESAPMAQEVAEAFDTLVPAESYEVRLSESGGLEWIEHSDGEVIRHRTEPGTSAWRRAWVAVLSWLPIEWML